MGIADLGSPGGENMCLVMSSATPFSLWYIRFLSYCGSVDTSKLQAGLFRVLYSYSADNDIESLVSDQERVLVIVNRV
jgi:hypothetical protein